MSHDHSGIGTAARNRIRSITGTQVQRLLSKLSVLGPHLPHLSDLPLWELISDSDYASGEVTRNARGERVSGGRHVLQECSILGHLRRIGALDSDGERLDRGRESRASSQLTAVEFGAGTGRLSERLQRVASDQDVAVVMIDRRDFAPAQCRDGGMRNRAARDDDGGSSSASVRRIVGDIAAVDIGQYCHPVDEKEADGESSGGEKRRHRCVCMSKHLCGPACDLAIAALERVAPPRRRPPFAFATCCHYLCTFDAFAGKEYWLRLGLTEEDFEVAVATSQWYSLKRSKNSNGNQTHNEDNCEENGGTCRGASLLKTQRYTTIIGLAADALKESMSAERPPFDMSSDEFERTFSTENKIKLGSDVKRLLDFLRITKLQELGYDVELVLYTTRSIENRLLVGT